MFGSVVVFHRDGLGEKKLKKVHEREENEKKLKQAIEYEENEKWLKEAFKHKQLLKRQKEVCKIKENEKRLRKREGRGSTGVRVHFFNIKKCLFIFKIYLFKCKNATNIYIYI